jgi:hypothetical protein
MHVMSKVLRQLTQIHHEEGGLEACRNIFLYFCLDVCLTPMYSLTKVLLQLHPILPEEGSRG